MYRAVPTPAGGACSAHWVPCVLRSALPCCLPAGLSCLSPVCSDSRYASRLSRSSHPTGWRGRSVCLPLLEFPVFSVLSRAVGVCALGRRHLPPLPLSPFEPLLRSLSVVMEPDYGRESLQHVPPVSSVLRGLIPRAHASYSIYRHPRSPRKDHSPVNYT